VPKGEFAFAALPPELPLDELLLDELLLDELLLDELLLDELLLDELLPDELLPDELLLEELVLPSDGSVDSGEVDWLFKPLPPHAISRRLDSASPARRKVGARHMDEPSIEINAYVAFNVNEWRRQGVAVR